MASNLAQLLVIAAAFGFQVIVTLYLQGVLGDSAATSGLGLLPAAVVIGTASPASAPESPPASDSARCCSQACWSSHSDAGLASGLFNTTQQIGAALGVAVLSALAAARTASLHAAGPDSASALTSGYRLAFATGAGLAVAAIIVAAILLRNNGSAPRKSKITDTVTRHAQV